jgi:LicD family
VTSRPSGTLVSDEFDIRPPPWRLALRRGLAGVLRPPPSSGCTKRTKRCDFWNWGGGGIRPSCCTQHLVELTRFAHDLLTRRGVPHWLDYGALLGAVREEALIPWDNDVDMGVLAKDLGKLTDLAREVKAAGYHLDGSDPYGVVRINYSKLNEQHVDLVPWYDSDGLLTTTLRGEDEWIGMGDHQSFPRAYVDRLEDVLLYGERFPAPSPVDRFLGEHRYGHDYMRPGRTMSSVDLPALRSSELTPAVQELLSFGVQREERLRDLEAGGPLSRIYVFRDWLAPGLPRTPEETFVERVAWRVPPSERSPAVEQLIYSIAAIEQAIEELERPTAVSRVARAGRRLRAVGVAARRELLSPHQDVEAEGRVAVTG